MKDAFYSAKYVYLVMDLMAGGELFDRIVDKDHYSEKEAKKAMVDILVAIQYTHKQNIVHRDLKPENILYASPADDAALKLADFGLAMMLDPNELMNSQCGTPGYVAPEVLMGHFYGKEVDMWSVGVILYILLCGFPPFYDENNEELYKMIVNARVEFLSPYWDSVSPEAIDLIRKMLEKEPGKRLTADQALEHPWIIKEASDAQLTFAQSNLKTYCSKRRFRGAIRAVIMANNLRKLIGNIRNINSTAPAAEKGAGAPALAATAAAAVAFKEATEAEAATAVPA
jgi:serine/threonine protein kinase